MDEQAPETATPRQEAGGRPMREFEAGERRWRVTVAWRAADGAGLCYFTAAGEDADAGDGTDRRVRLEPGRKLAEVTESELTSLLAEAVPLTATERRFRAPDGRTWLAQNIGPVWAEEDAAEGATGILFTALEGLPSRGETRGGHVGPMGRDELVGAWRRALDSGEEDAASRGESSAEAGSGSS